MAAKLADELLQMILVPSLTIPHEKFISSSTAAFGQNDNVSSASALLVCKRWLRVATPLLYESIVIRSAGQSDALSDALRQSPAFIQHVKKIRLEGAYPSIGYILTRCTNIKILVALLYIYSDANVTSLCRALPFMDPSDVILHDEWQIDNKKIRNVFLAFCDAIPKWKNMGAFAFPYPEAGPGDAIVEQNVNRREKLIDALKHCASLRVISRTCELYEFQPAFWKRLATIPSNTIKIIFCPHDSPYSLYVPFRECRENILRNISKDPELSNPPFEFIILSMSSSHELELENRVKIMSKKSSQPLKASSVPVNIWTTIFGFATVPDLHLPPSVFAQDEVRINLEEKQVIRNRLSLVCKDFEALVRTINFTSPILINRRSLGVFSEKILQNPSLGRQVHTIYVKGTPYIEKYDEGLCDLAPHLTCLHHFICCDPWLFSMSPKAFTLLAESAGSTLKTMAGFGFSDGFDFRFSKATTFPASVLNSFKNLVTLHVHTFPHVDDKANFQWNSLSTLRELRIEELSETHDTISRLSLSRLRCVTFGWAPTPTVENFLKACSPPIAQLEFRGNANFAEIFRNAPKLVDLKWHPSGLHSSIARVMGISLSPLTSHSKLQKFTLAGVLLQGIEKDHVAIIDSFFKSIDISKFPSLKEIRFANYDWPVDERAISRDKLPNMAIQVKQEHGVDIKDRSDKPWRPRAKRR